jgi:hypothetical protein
MRKAFDRKYFKISVFEVEAVLQSPHWIDYCFIYMINLLLVKFDWNPSNYYTVVKVIPSCFRCAKICLCQVQGADRVTSHLLLVGDAQFLYGPGEHVSLRVVNVTWIDLDPLVLLSIFKNSFSESLYS